MEYLIVGIRKGIEEDFREFYDKTHVETYIAAFSILGDRTLAREAAAETYKRVKSLAYKFNTDMSAEFWLCDMVRNICLNGLCDGEISQKATAKLRDNASILLSNALFETSEDRGKIIALRTPSTLSPTQTANLLWYNKASASAEYKRGLREAAEKTGIEEKSYKNIEKMLKNDMKAATPDYYELCGDDYITVFDKISERDLMMTEADRAEPGETQEARKARVNAAKLKKRRKNIIISSIIAGILLISAAIPLSIHFAKTRKTELKEEESIEIVEPQYSTSCAMKAMGGKLYFENHKDGGKFYVCDADGKNVKKISDAKPKDFQVVGNRLYFRDSATGRLCYYDNEVVKSEILGALPRALGDKIVYSSKNGVSVTDKNLSVNACEEIFTDREGRAFRYEIRTTEDGIVYFSAAPSESVYRLTLQDNTYFCDTMLDGFVIYSFEITDDYLIYEIGDGTLNFVRLDGDGKNYAALNDVLLSGAFCADGQNIYYYGKKSETSPKGIYRVNISDISMGNTGNSELLVDLSAAKEDVSDLYVDGDMIYCYFTNGAKEKAAAELSVFKSGDAYKDASNIFNYRRKK